MNPSLDLFEGQPHYTERLRADAEVLALRPDAEQQARYEEEAVSLLSSLMALDEHSMTKSEDEKDFSPELARLERKLDLVLELLSTQLMDAQAPGEVSVQLSARGARWATHGAVPAPGTLVLGSIYLHRMMPRPLRLPAEVIGDQAGWLQLRFLPLGEACDELLLRHVFQQHRRALAGHRRGRR